LIEYIWDVIRAVAGQECCVTAEITDELNEPITEGCCLVLHDEEDNMLFSVDGIYSAESGLWEFTISGELSEGLKGKYKYCIQHNGVNMCFTEPFYWV